MRFTRRWLPMLLLLGLLNVCARGDMTFLDESRWACPSDTLGASAGPSSLGLGRFDADASGSWVYPGDRRGWATAGQDSVLSSDGITAPEHADKQELLWHYEYHTQPFRSALHAESTTDISSTYLRTDRLPTWRDYRRTNYRMYSAQLELFHGAGIVFSASVDPDCRPPGNSPATSPGFSLRTLAAMVSISVPLP